MREYDVRITTTPALAEVFTCDDLAAALRTAADFIANEGQVMVWDIAVSRDTGTGEWIVAVYTNPSSR